MKLAEWARANGVHPQTAYQWFREDRMPAPARRLEPGTIWVDAVPAGEPGRVVVYARVSCHGQRQDLDRQVARLTGWATANGHAGGEVVTETATTTPRSTSPASATPSARAERGPVPGVARPPATGLDTGAEPRRRPRPRQWSTQQAVKRQPRTGTRRVTRGPPHRKARLPNESEHVHTCSSGGNG